MNGDACALSADNSQHTRIFVLQLADWDS